MPRGKSGAQRVRNTGRPTLEQISNSPIAVFYAYGWEEVRDSSFTSK
jgi:hypothetical protein